MKIPPYKKGLENVVATETNISSIDGKKGILRYRGYDIETISDNSSFEEVCFLLLYKKLPKKNELVKFKAKLNKNLKLSKRVLNLIKSFPKEANPMDVLRTSISLIGAENKQKLSKEELIEDSIKLIIQTPTIIANFHRFSIGKKIINPKKELSIAGNFLYMLNGKVDKTSEKVFDVCLILHAEHGLNASTFSSIVTASTLSDLYSSIVSAIATLKGPRHGGANEKVLDMLEEIKDIKNVKRYINNKIKKKERIMGFGHRVYRIKDPRAYVLEKYSLKLSESKNNYKYYKILKEIEKVVGESLSKKGIFPNVDFFSGSVYNQLNIGKNIFTPIFALSRMPGWCSHLIEEYTRNSRIIRPKAIYTGPKSKKYIKISKR